MEWAVSGITPNKITNSTDDKAKQEQKEQKLGGVEGGACVSVGMRRPWRAVGWVVLEEVAEIIRSSDRSP